MMKLSSAARVVHDVGLATSIGGTLFGRAALQPALHEIASPVERDLVAAEAWQRFSRVNLAGHLAFAIPWLLDRRLGSRDEVSRDARTLVLAKDIMVTISLATGVASVLLGRKLGNRGREGIGPEQVRESEWAGFEPRRTRTIKRAVGALGMLNLVVNVGIAAVTALLADRSSRRDPTGASKHPRRAGDETRRRSERYPRDARDASPRAR